MLGKTAFSGIEERNTQVGQGFNFKVVLLSTIHNIWSYLLEKIGRKMFSIEVF